MNARSSVLIDQKWQDLAISTVVMATSAPYDAA